MSSSSAGNSNIPTPTKRRRIIVENDDDEMENELMNLNASQRDADDREEIERVNEEIVEEASDVDSNPDVLNGNMLLLSSNFTVHTYLHSINHIPVLFHR